MSRTYNTTRLDGYMPGKDFISSLGEMKTYFIVKDREDFSIAKVLVASCETNDFSACGKAVFAARRALRENFPPERYAIDTITAPKLDLPITLDNSLIEYKVIA